MARYFPPALRRRIAPFILIVGVLLTGRTIQTEMPREQEVRFVLSPTQRNVRSVRVSYFQEGEAMSFVEFNPDVSADVRTAAPLVHTPSLKPGPYDVTIDIEDHNGVVRSISRRLIVPSEQVTIRLDPPTP